MNKKFFHWKIYLFSLALSSSYPGWPEKRYVDVEELLLQAWKICEQTLGPFHPKIVTGLNGLAALYHGQGRHTEAEALLQQASIVRQRLQEQM
jgi:hypothetical protein